MLPIFLLVLFIPTSLLAADFLPAASVSPLFQRGILRQEKTHIVDGNGHRVKLRGVNVNGWLLWEGWVWGGWFESETKILTKLERLVGTEEVKHFQQQVYEKFIGERDIERMSALGFNMVRIPINHRLLEEDENPFVYKESGWQILDRVLRWCEQYRVYAVLDLHSAPGGQGDLFTVDPEGKGKLWGSGIHQERTIALWKAVASRYKDSAVVAAYDLQRQRCRCGLRYSQ
ncbi:MAG: cellulase family glycosylhydrolase [Candidatus Omnitrophica bacterium]|nr:cellulase family glycosylhydrolase [Candidatus Omnitrophota bacterium]